MVLAATPNQHSSGQRRACSTSTIEIESMALMQCPSVLSAPTLMGHFYSLKLYCSRHTRLGGKMWCWRPPQINTSSGQRRACSTSTIEIESMALMQCPSVLSAPTCNGPFLLSQKLYCSRHTRLGGKMWCWRPPQINTHQGRDELVAPPPSRMRAWL